MATIEQIRAARALLGWSQHDLADHAELSQTGIARIENGTNKPNTKTMEKIENAFSRSHVEFIPNGVRKIRDFVTIYEGEDAYLRFLDDAMQAMKKKDDAEILFWGADEKRSTPPVIEKLKQMRQSGMKMRSLIKEDDTFIMGNLDEYRWMDKKLFTDTDVKAIYDNRVGYLVSWRDDLRVIGVKEDNIARESRNTFNYIWDQSDKPTRSTAKELYE